MRAPRTVAPKRVPKKTASRAQRPRLASSLVCLAGPVDDPHILMGRRSAAHAFMPGVFVFPGGRVERADSYAPFTGELAPRTRDVLTHRLSPRRARACVLAALRETFEETGLRIARPATRKLKAFRDPTWGAFVDPGWLPDLSGVEVLGRATTPPRRAKRFDTWFFLRHLGDAVPRESVRDSDELEAVSWYPLNAVADLKTHVTTDMMLATLADVLRDGHAPHVPFRRMIRGTFVSTPYPPS